jgi:hypothetical protein
MTRQKGTSDNEQKNNFIYMILTKLEDINNGEYNFETN